MYNIEKETGKKNFLTYKYKNRYIYSKYDPVKEAEKYLENISLKKTIITSCGADYINRALLDKNIELIIAIDPLDFDNSLKSEKIIRVKNVDELENHLADIEINDISVIFWSVLVELIPEVYLENLKKIKDILLKASSSKKTASLYGFKESKNALINILTSGGINVLKEDKNINNPALILSSGASLEDHIDFIKQAEKYFYIFALPSTLQFLDKNNINVDAVISVDPGYGAYYHLANYKKETYLITSLTSHPAILKLANYKKLYFNYNNYFEKLFFKNNNVISSPPEGSVFFNLLRIIKKAGFMEALIIGQDFGYKKHRSHIKGGSFEKEYISYSTYYKTEEAFIKELESRSEKITINDGTKKIESTVPLKVYYDHFLKENFRLKIMIPENAFNQLNNKFDKIIINDVLRKYKTKPDFEKIINIEKLENKKAGIKSLIKDLVENKINNIKKPAFIDINDNKHNSFLKKIIKGTNVK